jgi:hypothetical protein
LRAVEVRPINIPIHFHDFDDYCSPFLGGQGPAPGYAMSLDPGTNSFEPSDCQGWFGSFNGSGVGCSWTRAMTGFGKVEDYVVEIGQPVISAGLQATALG